MHVLNLVKFYQLVFKILRGNKILEQIKGHDSDIKKQKMTYNNPKLDIAKMNAHIKFSEILPIGSQDIEQKRFWRKSRTITLVQMCKK